MSAMVAADVVSEINGAMVRLDRELTFAKKAMGIFPDLAAANHYARTTNATLDELANLILDAADAGVRQPPDVIARIGDSDQELQLLVQEIAECNAIVTQRSAAVAAKRLVLS